MSIFVWGALALVVFHHLAYPALLKMLARASVRRVGPPPSSRPAPRSVTVIMPAWNEERFIAAKVADLARLDTAGAAVTVLIGCDGARDRTAERAREAVAAEAWSPVAFEVFDFAVNRGKVAVLNDLVARATGEILVFTDVSAAVAPDALTRTLERFRDAGVGVVCGGYELLEAGSPGEATYWRYQSAIKRAEAALGAPMGAHGSFYAIRRALVTPLPADTINDDFVVPMRAVVDGWRAVYDPAIRVTERERTAERQEFRRRARIGAGNLQQVGRLWRLASPTRPGVAFVFLAGKGLRALMPLLLPALLLASAALAVTHGGAYEVLFGLELFGLLVAATGVLLGASEVRAPAAARPLLWAGYLALGYLAALVGVLRLAFGQGRPAPARHALEIDYIHPLTIAGKRALDLVCGAAAFCVYALLYGPIALAIKLDSRGPVLYRQIRVGRCTPTRTDLFHIVKFRTMRVDAEVASGAVWARQRDPRITRVGHFLRKTRLDELPQCMSVLQGDMSIVGPRPERPAFFPKLESEIPFYAERTHAIKPGITGLAQVNHGYDASIDDVRTKVLFDHSYALRISRPLGWLKTDIGIIFKTVSVMALGKGQ